MPAGGRVPVAGFVAHPAGREAVPGGGNPRHVSRRVASRTVPRFAALHSAGGLKVDGELSLETVLRGCAIGSATHSACCRLSAGGCTAGVRPAILLSIAVCIAAHLPVLGAVRFPVFRKIMPPPDFEEHALVRRPPVGDPCVDRAANLRRDQFHPFRQPYFDHTLAARDQRAGRLRRPWPSRQAQHPSTGQRGFSDRQFVLNKPCFLRCLKPGFASRGRRRGWQAGYARDDDQDR